MRKSLENCSEIAVSNTFLIIFVGERLVVRGLPNISRPTKLPVGPSSHALLTPSVRVARRALGARMRCGAVRTVFWGRRCREIPPFSTQKVVQIVCYPSWNVLVPCVAVRTFSCGAAQSEQSSGREDVGGSPFFQGIHAMRCSPKILLQKNLSSVSTPMLIFSNLKSYVSKKH